MSHANVAEDVEGALSVRVTATVLVMPLPVTVTVPVLVPTTAFAVFTATVIEPLLVPEDGLIVSHDAFLLAVQETLEVTAMV